MLRYLLAALLLVVPLPLFAQPASERLPPDQAAIKAHVMFLASDAMRGREAGSPEYDIAAQYVASQFLAAGLKPAGDSGSFLQKVPLVAYKVASKGSVVRDVSGRREALVFGEDYLPAANASAVHTNVTAPVVFVGYGIVASRHGRNDFAGLDLVDKVVAFVSGAPAAMNGEERALFGSSSTKLGLAAEHGAIGAIVLATPLSEKTRPFARSVESYDSTRMTWAEADGTGHVDTPATPLLASLSLAGAAKLFAGAPRGWDTIVREAANPDARFTPVALPGTLSITGETTLAPAHSSNVVALVPGSDPALGSETVVLSAHLDHLGVGKPVNGDAINNGALDNAIGIASLIEEAKRFAGAPPPRRSILFLAVTAEEKGLIGSDYFVNHPTVPLANIVADVNLDMPILTYRFEDMIAFGGDRSTLGPIIAGAVKTIGVDLSPDPIPDEAIFVRSDHFRFVEKGIPSVFLWPGQKGPGKAAVTDFLANRYHRPSDEIDQGIDWSQGPRFVDVNYRIARAIADADAPPVWNKGDYFGTRFDGPMAN